MLISVMRNVLINPRPMDWTESATATVHWPSNTRYYHSAAHSNDHNEMPHTNVCVSYMQDAYSLRICGFRRWAWWLASAFSLQQHTSIYNNTIYARRNSAQHWLDVFFSLSVREMRKMIFQRKKRKEKRTKEAKNEKSKKRPEENQTKSKCRQRMKGWKMPPGPF